MFYKKYQQRLRLNNNMSITILHKNVSVWKKKEVEGEDSYSNIHIRDHKKELTASHILLLKHIN